ncbi:hypothetical protein [Flavobacterium aurantiibacter]|uniref:Outer membrane protein beta-barrel domain-containing protein n=1 Tax=Flavobacterium aurantiibacter TaxID=2023067 RepID=A0A256AE89_9FLAO|nr:hypothetical protein [Flavobacterium aurantiibacter]OYQ51484.1 hypothetical protein CHX27_00320 [Flavobacterium aurantiibacter]
MKKLILTVFFLITACVVQAQDNKESGIYFGAIIGTRYNNFERHFAADVDPELFSFSIGAGSAWTKNNYVIGFEFLYSNGEKNNSYGAVQLTGFTNTLWFGYNLSTNKKWKFEPNLGLVLSNNQLIAQNKTTNSFQNLTNNQLLGNLGINVRAVGKNGLFTGIKVGYMLPFAGETEWENKVEGTNTGLSDQLGTFYIQLNLGGFLDLSKTK